MFDHGVVTADAVPLYAPKEREKAVIVGLGNRVDFVVMTAGTTNRQTQKGICRRLENIIHIIKPGLFLVDGFVIPQAKSIVSGGNDIVRYGRIEFVTGKLLHYKLIIRLVVVEGSDDIIAIAPHKRFRVIPFIAVGFGIANDIQPMPTPLFAVMFRSQQPINQITISIRRLVFNKCLHVNGRRRQPREVVVGSAN